MHIEKKTLRNIFIGVGGCILLYWILHETAQVNAVFSFIEKIVSPFFAGAAIAFVLNVPMRSFENLLKFIKPDRLRRVFALTITFIAVLLVLTVVFVLLIPQVMETTELLIPQLLEFAKRTETGITNFLEDNPELMGWLSENGLMAVDWAGLAEKAVTWIGNSISKILDGTVSAISLVAGFLMDFVISIVFAIYCLFQKETLARQGRKMMYSLFPEKYSDETIRILRLTNSTFSNFLSGQCIEVLILGSLFAISMAIFRMPYIPLVSVLVAVTAFIPVVGAFAGCIIGAFLIFVNDPVQAVIFVGMFLVIQQIENNLIYPRVVGTSIGLSGMWVLVAVAVGGALFGVAGMFLMIPFASVLYTLLGEFTTRRLASRNIDGEKLKAQPPELRSEFRERMKRRKQRREQNKEIQPEDNSSESK